MEKPHFTILTGSCFEILPSLKQHTIDCVITDPTYSGFNKGNSQQDYLSWLAPLVRGARDICKKDAGIAISQPQNNHEMMKSYFDWEVDLIVQDAFHDKRGEDAHFLAKNVPQQPPDTFKMPTSSWSDAHFAVSIHPNARSVTKMVSIVQLMSRPGDTILDPFCGSGAIGIACVLLGRHYIGIELYPRRAEDARKRLELALSLFLTSR